MQTRGLLFIPDISGFTRFVKTVEIEHSRLIIQELLEILIDANETGLAVSEIEGDAILFYQFGERPKLDELYAQVEKMFTAFHKNLMAYEQRRYCQCDACLSAIDLTLKIITHYGEFTEYKVKNFSKLIGKDVILAHQLLKNNIDRHEYWLVTSGLHQDNLTLNTTDEIIWVDSYEMIEEDNVHFRYTQLGHLRNRIEVECPQQPDLSNYTDAFSLTVEYNTDIITLLHAAADFTYRPRWMQGVKAVEVQNHFLPRIGMKCIMTLESGSSTILAKHYQFQQYEIEFSEIDEQSGYLCYYRLEKLEDLRTKFALTVYIPSRFMAGHLFHWFGKKSLHSRMERSLQKLTELVAEIGDSVRLKAQPAIADK